MKVSYGLRQLRDRPQRLDLALERGMAGPELDALVGVINDDLLSETYSKLSATLSNPVWSKIWSDREFIMPDADATNEEWEKPPTEKKLELTANDIITVNNVLAEQFKLTELMHKRILELWERATQTEQHIS